MALDNKGINKLDESVVGVTISINAFCSNAGVGEAVGMKVYNGVSAKILDDENS
ncbi:MAG TPA: hypothetical protein VFZ76_00050 [Anaerolineales bacterium]